MSASNTQGEVNDQTAGVPASEMVIDHETQTTAPESTGEQTGLMRLLGTDVPAALAPYLNRIEIDPDGKMGLAIIAESENDFPIEAFKGLCVALNKSELSTPWRIAAALNSAEVLYGNKASQFQDAATFAGYSAGTLTQICFTEANVLPDQRRPDLSIWYHRKVAKLKPHEQKKLLKEAAKCPKEWAEFLGCKQGEVMSLKQLEKRVKAFKTTAGVPEGEKGAGDTAASAAAAASSEFAPKDEGGQRFAWSFRAREAREPLQDYINEERKAHAIAFQCHYDPQFKAEHEAKLQADADKERRKKERTKLETAVGALPESERKGFLKMFDGDKTVAGQSYDTVKAAINARKDEIKKATPKPEKAAKAAGGKKGGSKKTSAKKTNVAKSGAAAKGSKAPAAPAEGVQAPLPGTEAQTGETANPA